MKQNKGLIQKIVIVVVIIGILLSIGYVLKITNSSNKDSKSVTKETKQEQKEVVQDKKENKKENKDESKEEKKARLLKTWEEIRNNKETEVMDKVIGYAVSYDDHAKTELYKVKQDERKAKWSDSVDVLEETMETYESYITRYKERLLKGVQEYIEKNKDNKEKSDLDISYFEKFYEKYKNH